MNAISLALCLSMMGGAAIAESLPALIAEANRAFARLPAVIEVDTIAGRCGANHSVNGAVAYCTSENRIFLAREAAKRPQAVYLVAHVMGHAVQVQHGVADVALATIRANRDQEVALRMEVTQQVECIAGVLFAGAGFPEAELTDWFDQEPFRDAHWGRNPLTVGPKVGIGLAQRNAWFRKGQQGTIADCAVPTFGADLLIAAYRD